MEINEEQSSYTDSNRNLAVTNLLDAVYEYIVLNYPKNPRDLDKLCRTVTGSALNRYEIDKFENLNKGLLKCVNCKEFKLLKQFKVIKHRAKEIKCFICIECRINSQKKRECSGCQTQYSDLDLISIEAYNSIRRAS